MAQFLVPIQMDIALLGGCELAVLPIRWNLEMEGSDLLSLDFSHAFKTVNKTVMLDLWSKIFPETLPFVEIINVTPFRRLVASQDWTTPRCISVEEGD